MNFKIENSNFNHNFKFRINHSDGFTLLEILVVISIFAVLGILVTRSVVQTIGGSKKSESLIRVRDNLSYSINIIERQLRNANSIPGCGFSNNNSRLDYVDEDGNNTDFACITSDFGVGAVASGSAVLTGSDINVTGCSFTCIPGTGANPPTVNVSLEAVDATATGVQNSDVTLTTQIDLRNY